MLLYLKTSGQHLVPVRSQLINPLPSHQHAGHVTCPLSHDICLLGWMDKLREIMLSNRWPVGWMEFVGASCHLPTEDVKLV